MGPVSLQSAEFAKFATALALAKYMNSYSFTMKNWKNIWMMVFSYSVPDDAYYLAARLDPHWYILLSFWFCIGGMPGVVLFSGLCAVVYFVVGIRFDQVFIADTPTPIGEFAVLSMVLLSAAGMVWVYKKEMGTGT